MRQLELRYSRELAVVGVHSPKFPSEKETANLRAAVKRHHIEHAVVNDRDFQVFRQFTARAWPTLFLIDPHGKISRMHEGEITADILSQVLDQMIAEFDALGWLDRDKVPYQLDVERAPDSPLSFPGKLLADAASNRLFIVDSNHHRILVADLDGQVRQVIGSGQTGRTDGPAAEARFNQPQGLTLAPDGRTLYVADTENHLVRRIDLASGVVATLAGTGEQGHNRRGGPGLDTDLNSPWDLCWHDGMLYVTLAGLHQVWSIDPNSGLAQAFAGSGRENIVDGPRLQAELAQTSGISPLDGWLYIADSEVSAIRRIDPAPAGQVETIVGLGLFEFGDVDGVGEQVRLQHPLGVCARDGLVYVADTYNHKIKVVDPAQRSATTLFGTGEAGMRDGPGAQAQFAEPNGCSLAGDQLYIADTNNHRVRVANLASGEVRTLELRGL